MNFVLWPLFICRVLKGKSNAIQVRSKGLEMIPFSTIVAKNTYKL